MKGNNPLFNNGGNKKISRSKYSKNQNKAVPTIPYNNKKGEILLKRVKSEEARNYIRQNYRSGAKIGDGSTAAAVKEELKHGVKIGGKSHITKAKEGAHLPEVSLIQKALFAAWPARAIACSGEAAIAWT